MPFDANAANVTVGVVGTGSMGRGIMQVAAQGGMRVIAYDEKPGAAEAAKAYIAKMLDGLVQKGRVPADEAKSAVDRIAVAKSLEEVAKANIIVEAIVERLDAKQALFARLDELSSPDTIIASNTSSLPITAIASKCKRPERVGGMHFFNPVPLMRLVEIIPGLKTAPWVTEAMTAIGRRMTREPVLCTDSPAFLVNHVGRAFVPESQRILSEGIASADRDRPHPHGRAGLQDGPVRALRPGRHRRAARRHGVDLRSSSTTSRRLRPSRSPRSALPAASTARRRVRAGTPTRTARRSSRRWRRRPTARPKSVWVRPSEHHPDLQAPLVDLFKQAGANRRDGSQAERRGADRGDADRLGPHDRRRRPEARREARRRRRRAVRHEGPAHADGDAGDRPGHAAMPPTACLRPTASRWSSINDSPGFVAQRVVAQIVNIGCGVAQRAIAIPADIDKGTKLGLGYPFGPLEWGDRLGAGRVLYILERLHAFYGEPRYRPSPWLKRRVALGLPLSAPEGR